MYAIGKFYVLVGELVVLGGSLMLSDVWISLDLIQRLEGKIESFVDLQWTDGFSFDYLSKTVIDRIPYGNDSKILAFVRMI